MNVRESNTATKPLTTELRLWRPGGFAFFCYHCSRARLGRISATMKRQLTSTPTQSLYNKNSWELTSLDITRILILQKRTCTAESITLCSSPHVREVPSIYTSFYLRNNQHASSLRIGFGLHMDRHICVSIQWHNRDCHCYSNSLVNNRFMSHAADNYSLRL